jgi:hypothetical protein
MPTRTTKLIALARDGQHEALGEICALLVSDEDHVIEQIARQRR